MGVGAAALLFAWGFAEATVFFIVADVAVSWTAIFRGAKAGLFAALAAALGAIPGLALLYGWAAKNGARVFMPHSVQVVGGERLGG